MLLQKKEKKLKEIFVKPAKLTEKLNFQYILHSQDFMVRIQCSIDSRVVLESCKELSFLSLILLLDGKMSFIVLFTETKNCFPCWLDIFLISEEKRKLSRVKRGQKASKDFKMIEFNVSFLS